MDCPDDDALALFVENRSNATATSPLAQHIKACEACAALVLEYAEAFGLPTVSAIETEPPPSRATASRGLGLVEGDLFGRYVIMRLAGRGGMGEVYAAYDPELDRHLALKIVLPGRDDSPGARERLMTEARHAASLTHPNVVTVYAVGVIDDRPYIAMELVNGEPMSRWLTTPHTAAETLDVFMQAAAGLHAAHQAGVVHRDFKPSNVLIGRDGRARVADFGLARSVREAAGREIAGTPAYMAPEQLRGEAFDARSDQYSFAVALGQAFGVHPVTTRARAAPAESDTRQPIAVARRWTDRALWRRVGRVVRRAGHDDPERRYPSMAALSEELAPSRKLALPLVAAGLVAVFAAGSRLPLSDEPEACVRTSVLATAVPKRTAGSANEPIDLPAAAVAYDEALSVAWQTACLDPTVDALEVACLDNARSEFSAVAAAFAAGGPGVSDRFREALTRLPDLPRCRDTSRAAPQPSRPWLDAPVRSVRRSLAAADGFGAMAADEEAIAALDKAWSEAQSIAFPPVAAEVLARRGHWLLEFGQVDDARRLLTRAHHLAAAERHDAAAAETAIAMVRLETIAERHDAARTWVRHAEVAVDRYHDEAQPIALLSARGQLAIASDDAAGALPLLQQALRDHRELDPGDPALSERNNLAIALLRAGRFSEAEALLTEIAVDAESVLGPTHPLVGVLAQQLGVSLDAQGRSGPAESSYRRAVEILQGPGVERPRELAMSQANLGIVLVERREPEEALVHLASASQLMESTLGRAHPHWANVQRLQGVALVDLGRHDEAEAIALRSLDELRANFGDEDIRVAEALALLAMADRGAGRLDKAAARAREGLAITRARQGSRSRAVAGALIDLGGIEHDRRDYPAAQACFAEAIAIVGETPGRELLHALDRLALAQRDAGELDEALATNARAIAVANEVHGPLSHSEGALSATRGTIRLCAGRLAEAESDLARGASLLDEHGDTRLRLRVLRYLAEVQARAGSIDASRETLRTATELAEQTEGGNDELRAAEAWIELVVDNDPPG